MLTSRREIEAARNAALLQAAVHAAHPDFAVHVHEYGAETATTTLLDIAVHRVAAVTSGCGVAGSSDVTRRTISVVTATRRRMDFTILHEVGHIVGANDIPFQEALEASALTRDAVERNVAEEDACEQFAANLLVGQELVDSVLATHGATARGLWELSQAAGASLQACAVAWARSLPSTGYVAIVDLDGNLQFAARSGDVYPLRRGTAQENTDVWRHAQGRDWQGRSRLRYPAGSATDEYEVDAHRTPTGLLLVAVSDSPAWSVPFRRPPARTVDALRAGYCEECGTDFMAARACETCDEPRHDVCGRCGCGQTVARGSRPCTGCGLTLPALAFPDPMRDVCDSCT